MCVTDVRAKQQPWSHATQNIPLLLYSWGYIPVSRGNRMTKCGETERVDSYILPALPKPLPCSFTWIPNGGADTEAMVALDEMYDFYSMIRDRFLAFNGTSFEQDNMGSYSSGWSQVRHCRPGWIYRHALVAAGKQVGKLNTAYMSYLALVR